MDILISSMLIHKINNHLCICLCSSTLFIFIHVLNDVLFASPYPSTFIYVHQYFIHAFIQVHFHMDINIHPPFFDSHPHVILFHPHPSMLIQVPSYQSIYVHIHPRTYTPIPTICLFSSTSSTFIHIHPCPCISTLVSSTNSLVVCNTYMSSLHVLYIHTL